MDLGGVRWVRLNPLFASIHPENPRNGVSDIPDFKLFPGEHAPRSPIITPLVLTNSNPSSQNPGSTPGVKGLFVNIHSTVIILYVSTAPG